jgi:molybdopterin biosynthesis enzyme MoaB
VTPEALAGMWTKPVPGFGERLRESGAAHTPLSWLSRSEAGLVEKTLVVLLPGRPTAVLEGLHAIEGLLSHAIHVARGGDHGKRG